jgi:hypothetical protein
MGPRQAQAQALVWHTPRTEDTYLLGPKPHRAAHRASFRVFVSSFATYNTRTYDSFYSNLQYSIM